MQASSSIHNQHIAAARSSGLDRIIDHRTWISARPLANHWHVNTLAPDLELVDGGGAEGIGGGEHHLVTLLRQAQSHFADAGGFA